MYLHLSQNVLEPVPSGLHLVGCMTFGTASSLQLQAFFDRMVYDKTRPQIAADLAKLAHDSTGVSAQAIERQLALTPGNDPHPGSNINGVNSRFALALMHPPACASCLKSAGPLHSSASLSFFLASLCHHPLTH